MKKRDSLPSLLTSIETLLQLILGKFDVLPIMKANAQLGFAFYALYNILVVLMLVNILVSILTDHYNEEKMGIEWNAEDPDLFVYLISILGSVFGANKKEKFEPVYIDSINGFQVKIEQFLSKFNKVKLDFFC